MDRIGNGLQLGCEEERAVSKPESQVSVMNIVMDYGHWRGVCVCVWGGGNGSKLWIHDNFCCIAVRC